MNFEFGMEEFVYWRHPTLPCIKVEEITEGDGFSGAAWLEGARQIYGENGREEYREIGHYQNGAPFLYNSAARISVTHCPGLLAVATLPDTPEVQLSEYSDRAALGIDAERNDRVQAQKLRDRFLSSDELSMIPADDVRQNVLAWTIKEAVYKAALTEGLDFREQIHISRMPKLGPATPVFDVKEFGDFTQADYGRSEVLDADGKRREFILYSYESDDFIITLAYSPRSSRFNKKPM